MNFMKNTQSGCSFRKGKVRPIIALSIAMAFAACSSDTIESTAAENEKFAIPLESYAPAFLKKGDKIVLTAFGAGFTWGAMYIVWDI